MVFQDPYSAMNPVFRVSHGVMRNLKLHRPDLEGVRRREEAERVFDIVGLNPAGPAPTDGPGTRCRIPCRRGRLC
jgi:peptide/nickel transport system ATP-binding protein